MQHHLAPSTPRYSPYLSTVHSPSPVYLAGHNAEAGSMPYPRKTRSPQNFKCPYEGCEAAFARDEHLTRHERTHSQEKPFHCTLGVCDKWFSRLDNVRQHIKSQHTTEVANGQADILMRDLASLQKQISAAASARRRARRTDSTDSLPSMNGLRLANGNMTHSPELMHSYPSSSSASASSVSPPTPSDSPPHGPSPLGNAGNPHMRMQSAPTYLPNMQYNMSPSPSLYRQSFFGSQSEDNVATLAKLHPSHTWTPPPVPTPRFGSSVQRKLSLPSLNGMPANGNHSGPAGTPMPMPAVTQTNGMSAAQAFNNWGSDDFNKPIVSPTTAFFSMALNGYNTAEDQMNGDFRFVVPEYSGQQAAQQQQTGARRPSSSSLLEYVLAAPHGNGPPSHMAPQAIVPSMTQDAVVPDWPAPAGSLAPPAPIRARSHLSSSASQPASSPRHSPLLHNAHRFEGLAAAFQRTHSNS